MPEYGSNGSNKGSINSFVSHFKEGFVYPNLFRVTFSGNDIVNGKEILTYACKTCSIPGTTFTEGKFYKGGYYNKYVTGADYDPVTFTFICDATMVVIDVFDEWNAKIMKDGKFGFKDEYKCQITVEILNREGGVIYTAQIIDAYPTNITAFDLSWDNSGKIMTYDIAFNYLKIA
jgi:hypothetical protein